jgi:uncharacterized protein DUF4845
MRDVCRRPNVPVCDMPPPRRHSGLSLIGLIVIAALLAVALLVGFKLTPPYIEYLSLKNVLNTIINEPEIRDATVKDIRSSFSRRAQIADVNTVTANDIEISRQGGTLTLSTSYSVKVPLAGNVSACLDFDVTVQK